jgi:hypothetical protein
MGMGTWGRGTDAINTITEALAAPLSGTRQPEHAPDTARPWWSVESRRCTPTVLTGRPNGPPTVLAAWTRVRYASVDTAT